MDDYDKMLFVWLKQKQPWLLSKQCDPKKWGHKGWQSILGLIWYVCFKQTRLFVHVWNMLHWVAPFLLCKYCSKHFYTYQIHHPLDYDQCVHQPHLLFEWICTIHQKVHQRMKDCGETCNLQQWINAKTRNTSEWKHYFEQRIGNPIFRRLWLFDVLLFYTTIIRCIIEPEHWSPLIEYGFRSYMSSITILLFSISEKIDLSSPVVTIKNTNTEWSRWWIKDVMCKLLTSDKLVETILEVAQQGLPVYTVK